MTVRESGPTVVHGTTAVESPLKHSSPYANRKGNSMLRSVNIAVGFVTTVVAASGTIQAGSLFFTVEMPVGNNELAVLSSPVQNEQTSQLKQGPSRPGANRVKANHQVQEEDIQDLLQISEISDYAGAAEAIFLRSLPKEPFSGDVTARAKVASTAFDWKPRITVREMTDRVLPIETGYETSVQSNPAGTTSTILKLLVFPQTPDESTLLLGEPRGVRYEKITRSNEPELGLLAANL